MVFLNFSFSSATENAGKVRYINFMYIKAKPEIQSEEFNENIKQTNVELCHDHSELLLLEDDRNNCILHSKFLLMQKINPIQMHFTKKKKEKKKEKENELSK